MAWQIGVMALSEDERKVTAQPQAKTWQPKPPNSERDTSDRLDRRERSPCRPGAGRQVSSAPEGTKWSLSTKGRGVLRGELPPSEASPAAGVCRGDVYEAACTKAPIHARRLMIWTSIPAGVAPGTGPPKAVKDDRAQGWALSIIIPHGRGQPSNPHNGPTLGSFFLAFWAGKS